MSFDLLQYARDLSILAVPVLMAITFHEVAHGYVAFKLGDPTARMMGRLTLNPLKHLDVMGTLAFLITQMIGWAKPVPVDPRYFKNPRKGMVLVSLAGPGMNFLLATLCSLLLEILAKQIWLHPSEFSHRVLLPLAEMCQAGVYVNLALGVFNLLPLPPLDGAQILAGFLPQRAYYKFMSFSKYGFIVLILLAVSGFLGSIISPIVKYLANFLL